MTTSTLFRPLQLGGLELPNRIVMAPMTRMRAAAGGVPTSLNAMYYAQRAGAGLVLTEATGVSPGGRGYPNMPGIWSPQQIAGWQQVTDLVHAAGGRIGLQIVHHGRWSHSLYGQDGRFPVAPSAIPPTAGFAVTPTGDYVPFETPRALEISELPGIVDQFGHAARNAIIAGFDAVEIHGANGFLLDQFLQDTSNIREDEYGGPVENRARLLLEVVDTVAAEIGADRLGVRLSPYGNLGGLADSDPIGLFGQVIQALGLRELAWLHLIEPRASSAGIADDASVDAADNAATFRRLFPGAVISAGGYSARSAAVAIERGDADAIAFGRHFIANPDLVARIRDGAPLNPYDRTTFYGGDERGYTDYPTLRLDVMS